MDQRDLFERIHRLKDTLRSEEIGKRPTINPIVARVTKRRLVWEGQIRRREIEDWISQERCWRWMHLEIDQDTSIESDIWKI